MLKLILATYAIANSLEKYNQGTLLVLMFRQQFVRRQRIIHTYGREEEDNMDEDEALAVVQRRLRRSNVTRQPEFEEVAPPVGARVSAATKEKNSKKCKCGSSTHKRISNKDCPLNKRKASNS